MFRLPKTAVALLLIGSMAITSFADDKDSTKSSEKAKKVNFASFTLKTEFSEGPESEGLFGSMQPRLHEVIKRLDEAAADSKLGGVILHIKSPELRPGTNAEVRAAITRIRKADKKVYAFLESAMNQDYVLATACDQIIIPPSDALIINGLQMELTFFKRLFDKLGVRADFIQVGDFKGASEPFTRAEMSPEFRKQLDSVVDDYYQQMVTSIAEARKLDADKVKQLIDQGLFTAEEAKQAGLVDRICYEDELEAQLKSEHQAEELAINRKYGKKQREELDFSGIGGFMKFMELMTGGDAPKKKSSKRPKIAVIYAVGAIMTGESSSGFLDDEMVGSDTIVKAIQKAEEDDSIKAIVLRVNSPGGSALASDLIWREIVRAKKPVIASMGDVAASGGYYISMGAKRIFAEPGTLTGSIGVVGGKIAVKGLLDKIGVNTEVVRRGQNSGTFSITEPFTDHEREAWKRLMGETYKQFTTKVAEGRKLDVARVQELAQGKIYTGRMAVDVKLVDQIGTLQDAVAAAKEMAGLKDEDKAEVEILPEPKSIFDELFGGDQLEAELRSSAPEVVGAIKSLKTMRRLFAEPAVLIMPARITVR